MFLITRRKRKDFNRSLYMMYLFKVRFLQLFRSLISCTALCPSRERVMPPLASTRAT